MGRKYVHKPGTKFRNYKYPNLEDAITAIDSGEMTLVESAKAFKIPKSTLHDKYRRKYKEERPGRKTALSSDTEKTIVKFLLQTSLWGFPQTSRDLTNFVSNFLVMKDIKVTQFKNGSEPGKDWVKGFLERHQKELSERFANNIKRSRAEISEQVLDNFYDELRQAIADLPPKAIFNYDESNLADDPGKKKFIFKRGVKYPDQVINHTKSSISFMMCASADGCVLPPYVVYKAKNVHPSWKVSGKYVWIINF